MKHCGSPHPAHISPGVAAKGPSVNFEHGYCTVCPHCASLRRTCRGGVARASPHGRGAGAGGRAFGHGASAENVAHARALGLKVGAWTVNEPAEIKKLLPRELDAICTDRPDLLAAAISV